MSERQPTTDVSTDVNRLMKSYDITEKQASLLTHLILCGGNLTKAARLAGTDRRIHYDCLGYSEGYQAAYKSALFALGNEAMMSLADKAINGDYVTHNGEVMKDPQTGEYLRKIDTIAGIYVSKAAGKFTDQPETGNSAKSGPTIHISFPQQSTEAEAQRPTIEINQAEE